MRRLILTAALTGLSSAGPVAHATDFTWTPSARSMMRIDDNIRGAAIDPERAWGFDVGAGVKLKAQNENLTSELKPDFNLRRFVIGDNLDADEYSVAFDNDWLQERYTAGFDVSYVRDSTLTTEATDTGRRQDVTDRDSVSLQPSVSWLATDRITLQSNFLYSDVSYVDAQNTGYDDYRYLQGSAGATYRWREDVSVFATFFVSDFKVPDQDSKTRSYGGQTGATWQLPDQLELSGALGWISSNIDFVEQRLTLVPGPPPTIAVTRVPNEASASGPIASVTIRKQFELLLATFDYARQVSPSGRGSQSTADHIALQLERRLSPRLSVFFDGEHDMRTAEVQQISGLSPRTQSLNRDRSELRGTVRYRLTPEWSASAAYRFAHRASTGTIRNDTADLNTIFVTLQFSGLPQHLKFGL